MGAFDRIAPRMAFRAIALRTCLSRMTAFYGLRLPRDSYLSRMVRCACIPPQMAFPPNVYSELPEIIKVFCGLAHGLASSDSIISGLSLTKSSMDCQAT